MLVNTSCLLLSLVGIVSLSVQAEAAGYEGPLNDIFHEEVCGVANTVNWEL